MDCNESVVAEFRNCEYVPTSPFRGPYHRNVPEFKGNASAIPRDRFDVANHVAFDLSQGKDESEMR